MQAISSGWWRHGRWAPKGQPIPASEQPVPIGDETTPADVLSPNADASECDLSAVEQGLGRVGDEIFPEDALRVLDESYRIAPVLPEATTRCQHILQRRIYFTLVELIDATKKESLRIEKIEDDLLDLVLRYYSFIPNQAAVYNLGKASRETVQGFLTHLRDEEAPHMPQDLDAWVTMHPTRPFEDLVNYMLETPIGKTVFSRLPTETVERGSRRYKHYPELTLKRLRLTLVNVVLAFFFGVPVAILSLDLVSPAIEVVICIVFVVGASALSSFFAESTIVFALLIAYASILANSLGS